MPRAADPLATYNAKRDFAKTAEPAGRKGRARGNGFMVQKHDATRLHWDFRLELDGVLKSWAVTRGPSLDPDDKRLAVRTEDHPLSYASFEGTIPKGEYGGGTVMLWDRGTWTPAPGKDPRKTLEQGHLHFTLDGERMKGEWLLIRLKPRAGEKRENWLLRKLDDAHAGGSDDLVAHALTSVETGRSMAEIARGAKPVSLKGKRGKAFDAAMKKAEKATQAAASSPRTRGSSAAPGAAESRSVALASRPSTALGRAVRGNDKGRGTGRLPAFRAVQKATLVDHAPTGNGWFHEMKYDGYRCLLAIGGGKVRIHTRTGLDWTDRFSGIAEAAQALDLPASLIDGEIVMLNREGNPDFSALQAALREDRQGFTFFAFDLLSLQGRDLTKTPNIARKEKLAALLADARPPIVYAEHVLGSGERLFDAMCGAGQEGVVSKKADAPYRGGRTRAWLKVKCTRRQEFVILGWLPSTAGGRSLRSLYLGTREDGQLRYAGKVGTGFNADNSNDLMARLARIERKTPAVEIPRAIARGGHWVTPKLVAEVAFAEFTADKVVRHASFLGLREDKEGGQVSLEKPGRLDEEDLVRITNRDRLIFPEAKVTKGDLADYYEAIGPAMAPWALGRPISLVRCPQGRAKKCFFQKHDAGSFGEAVRHLDIREKDGGVEPYLYVETIVGLLACVQMGTIEFHGWGASVSDIEKPDRLIFDLDPDPAVGFDDVKKAADDIRSTLEEIGLASFAMLSGGKGIHVVVPLTPKAKWPEVKDFAQRFALSLAQAEPERFIATMSKAKRKGLIFIDWLRNQRGATAILPYSARARPGAPVAVPLNWSELKTVESAGLYSVKDVKALLKRAGSAVLQGWGEAAQVLPDI
ncbi:DNA ligase D [Sphingomonas colocasiae]|uniref:DNA ligase (ATP) n=1 Tax=Sphingomonas colocasiae TaxID=1848973 RepID=A0ABS7PJS3_9SPHN|nr:DNA ligase D [Sphingomonas colocasiae]MBY8821508.1 DNA ligase D [Sphingomonas colocasiae]